MSIKKFFYAPSNFGLGAMRRTAMLLVVMLLTTATAWATITGSGTQEDPYVISSKADWNNATQDTKYYTNGVYVELEADIDFGRNNCNRFGFCTMHFDGKGHTISNFSVNASNETDVAPFKTLAQGGTISNLTIANSTLTGQVRVAGIVSVNLGTVSNCHVESSVTITANDQQYSDYCGGIAAKNGDLRNVIYTGTIINCTVGAKFVLANRMNQPYFGGIVGRNYGESPVSGCLNYSTSVSSVNYFKSIIGSYSDGDVITNNYYRPVGSFGHGAPSATVVRAVSGIPSGVAVSPAILVSHGGYDYIVANTTFTLTTPDYKAFNDDFSVSGTGSSYSLASNKTSASVTIAADDVTINASLRNFTYTVVFNGNGSTGSTTSNQAFEYSIAQNLADNGFSRAGYDFAGWATEADGDVVYSNEQNVINLTATDGGTVNLYAKWTAITYTVHFYKNHNDATGTMSDMDFTYDKEQPLTAIGFSRTGYTFAGWSIEADGDVVYSDEQSVENLTTTDEGTVNLYAQWTPITYTITYNLDGGTLSTNKNSYTIESNNITLDNPTRTGYIFTGWTGTDLAAATMSVTIAHGSFGNRSYTATWKPVAFSVRFNGNGATSGTMVNQDFAYDVAQPLTANAFGRAFTVTYHYNGATGGNDVASVTATATCNGWATTADGDVVYDDQQSVSNLTTVPGATVDLFVNWTDASVILPTPTRTGYTLVGWYSDADLTTKVDDAGASYTPDADIDLYAHWILNTSIDVSFTSHMDDGDDAYLTVTMMPKDISIEPNPITTVAKVNVDTKSYFVPIVNGVGTCIVSNLLAKTIESGYDDNDKYIYEIIPYDVQAVFEGDDQYKASTSVVKQLTVEKIPTTLTISVDKTTVNVGEPVTVTVELEPKINALISVGNYSRPVYSTSDGNNYSLVIVKGRGTRKFSHLPAPTQYIAAVYAGDNRYIPSKSEAIKVTITQTATTTGVSVTPEVIAK